MLDAADIQIGLGPDYEGIFARLTLTDIGHCLVIDIVAVLHRLHSLGILTQHAADHTHHGRGLFDIIRGTGQNDHVALVAFTLHKAQRDRIRDAAVQKLLVTDFNNTGNQGHGTGGAEPLQHLPLAVIVAQVIDRLAGLDIRADQIELHGILAKCLPVKGIQFLGNIMVAELGIKKITRLQK